MDASHPLHETLVLQADLPLTSLALSAFPASSQIEHDYESNEKKLLRLTGSMHEHVMDSHEFAELAPEFARLDEKLNLLIDLVGSLLVGRLGAPAPVRFTLSARGLVWKTNETMMKDQCLALDLYVMAEVPRPIRLYATVLEYHDGQVTAVFHGISGSFENLLEKYLFRQHRREIASGRS